MRVLYIIIVDNEIIVVDRGVSIELKGYAKNDDEFILNRLFDPTNNLIDETRFRKSSRDVMIGWLGLFLPSHSFAVTD